MFLQVRLRESRAIVYHFNQRVVLLPSDTNHESPSLWTETVFDSILHIDLNGHGRQPNLVESNAGSNILGILQGLRQLSDLDIHKIVDKLQLFGQCGLQHVGLLHSASQQLGQCMKVNGASLHLL